MVEQQIELLPVLEQIEREKGIKKSELLKTIEIALISAFRKHAGNKNLNLDVHLDENTGKIKAYHIKKVVENVSDPDMEISLTEALKLKPKAHPDMDLKFEVSINEFGRIAAQTAKQVIIQKIREIEKDNLFNDFSSKIGQVVNGMVYKFVGKNIIVDIGRGEAILPVREQCAREKFNVGDRIKVYVVKVEKTPKGPQMVVSRMHPELIKNLFRLEVPEVYDNTVEIKNIVREPGTRIKVAVLSHNAKVDAIGSCVGVKGIRIKAIIQELQGARIDMVNFSTDASQFIVSALSPAKVLSIDLDEGNKSSRVVVADDQLSLAIGKDGQNVRLAAKLTGWHIDIKSESEKKEAETASVEERMDGFTELEGVGKKTAQVLIKSGFKTVESLAAASVETLTALQGIGDKMAQKVINSAKKELKAKAAEGADVSKKAKK
ncbi:MAG: transcription termination/antitermination protein NusA [Elusimicrobia bacterium]|nr:transcription termination/antitermination protein NusA [Elusimicrobiota bacterium]